MRWLSTLLLVPLSTLAISLSTSAGAEHGGGVQLNENFRLSPAAPKLFCERPRSLRLRRFEDRSARLECAGRVVARVSVPG